MYSLLVLVLFLWTPVKCGFRSMKTNYDSESIKCYITDFPCFKAQFRRLKYGYLLGNAEFNISRYKPFTFQYGSPNKCIRISGLQHSELIGLSYDSFDKELIVTIYSPLRIQEETMDSGKCDDPDIDAKVVALKKYDNPKLLRKFIANCSIKAIFSYKLVKINDSIHMSLDDPDIEMMLDIPDLSGYDVSSEAQKLIYEASEWAYLVVQQFDVGEKIALPFIQKYKTTVNNIPLKEFILIQKRQNYESITFDIKPDE